MQIQMLNLLTKAVNENRKNSEKIEILDQLISFTQVHFMSEKLIMRKHSYAGYDEHDQEHEQLIDRLNELKQQVNSNSDGLDLEKLNQLRNLLLNHISIQDKRFSQFLLDLAT